MYNILFSECNVFNLYVADVLSADAAGAVTGLVAALVTGPGALCNDTFDQVERQRIDNPHTQTVRLRRLIVVTLNDRVYG